MRLVSVIPAKPGRRQNAAMTRKPFAAILLTAIWTLSSSGKASAEGVIHVTRLDCARLVAHRPDADVAYQPGVDAQGNPVTPADLDGTNMITLPDTIAIFITVDLQERFGIPANSALFESNAYIGIASFRFSGGEITFNGRNLTDPEQTALAAACATVH